jgi:hypothetical protein
MFSKKSVIVCAAAAVLGLGGVAAQAAPQTVVDWHAFEIRNTGATTITELTQSGPSGPAITGVKIEVTSAGNYNPNTAGNTSPYTISGSTKVGFGTDYFNGKPLSSISSISWNLDQGANPYINLWVSDGTNYIDFTPGLAKVTNDDLISGSTNSLNGVNLQSAGAYLYEGDFSSDVASWLAGSGNSLKAASNHNPLQKGDVLVWKDGPYAGQAATLAEIAANNPNLIMASPDPTYGSWVSTGAARASSAVNLIFDAGSPTTLEISSVAVPEPSALGLVGLAGLALLARRRRRVA